MSTFHIVDIGVTTVSTNSEVLVKVYREFADLTGDIIVNYTVTGTGSDKIDLTSGSFLMKEDDYVHHFLIKSLNTVVGTESFTITLTPDVNYTIGSNSSVTLNISDIDPTTAYPNAIGAGAFTTGGRGGVVYHVTTLQDYNPATESTIVGSFRWAMAQLGSRYIVFDVSGTIELKATLFTSSGNVTVLGQTAPQGGITITGAYHISLTNNKFTPRLDNFIFRYIKLRPFYEPDPTTTTAYTMINLKQVIIDHNSVSFAGDKGIGISDIAANYTITNNLLGENSTGMIVGLSTEPYTVNGAANPDRIHSSFNNTIYKNLFYDSGHRASNVHGFGRVDMNNNVSYNYNFRTITIGGGLKINIINNYYDRGNRTPSTTLTAKFSADGTPVESLNNLEIYYEGNEVKNWIPVSDWEHWSNFATNYEWDGTTYTLNTPVPLDFRTTNQFSLIGKPYDISLKGEALLNDLIPTVGANKYIQADGTVVVDRDTIDQRYIDNMIARTYVDYNWQENWGSYQHYINFENSISTTPINTRPANYYNSNKSNDLPEVWFDANVPTGFTATDINPNTGRAYIEDFANLVEFENANPSIVLNGAYTVNLEIGDTYTELGATATDTEDGDITNDIVIDNSSVNTNVEGTYQVTYNVQDSNGNNANQVIRNVIVSVLGNITYPLTENQKRKNKCFITKFIKWF